MRIGIFDSGVGGLIVAAPIMQALPQYDYVYLGDAKNVPYGDRTEQEIYELTVRALRFLFAQDCSLVIIACNTVSAEALHEVQDTFVPREFPDKKVLGVIIPMAEEAARVTRDSRIGVLATSSTVASKAYPRELGKLMPGAVVAQEAASGLVPLIEHRTGDVHQLLQAYLAPLLEKNIDTLILGCTHYPKLKQEIKAELPEGVTILSPDEVMPAKLSEYLGQHPEIEQKLSKNGTRTFMVTKSTAGIEALADQLYGSDIDLQQVEIAD